MSFNLPGEMDILAQITFFLTFLREINNEIGFKMYMIT